MSRVAAFLVLVFLLGGGIASADPAVYEADAATPDPTPPVVWYDGEHTPEGAVGVLIHWNRVAFGNSELHEFTIPTPYGDIIVTRADTPNNDCIPMCPDPVRVERMPPGLRAEPDYVLTQENQTDWLVIYSTEMF